MANLLSTASPSLYGQVWRRGRVDSYSSEAITLRGGHAER